MQRLIKHILVLLLLIAGSSQCGPDSVVLLIHVKNLTPDVNLLQIDAVLDGKSALQSAAYSQRLSQVAVKLPREAIGRGVLSVSLFGLAADRCKISAVRYDTQVSIETPYTEVDLSLALLPSKVCTLTVEKEGDGIITSSPFGIDCGKSCSADLAPGTKVVLTATSMTPFSQAFWGGDCAGAIDTCALTMTKAQKVTVQLGPEVRPKLVIVPKGSFTMGSPTGESGRAADETQHAVTLTTDFWMADSEVTQRQYRNLMGTSPSKLQGSELPVEQVTWFDAVAYCNALSAKENLSPCYQINEPTVVWADGVKCTGYRLPTEAEWEYAARSSATTVYAGSDNVDLVAWYSTNAGGTTHAVKTKTANGRGLYDLSGNVWEWVWDWYQGNYEALPPTDPIGPASGSNRVIRGGSFLDVARDQRVADRGKDDPKAPSLGVGIRPVRSIP